MKNILTIASLVVALIQGASELIRSFEVGAGFGAEKKNIVLGMLEQVFSFSAQKLGIDYAWDSVKGVISVAIDGIVGFYNAVGVFKK